MRKISKTEIIVTQLRNKVDTGELPANELITEAEVAAEYSVSITPAREALNILCVENYFEKLPHKGYLVKGITYTDVQHLFQFRMVLENAITEIAIEKASLEELTKIESDARTILSLSDEELLSHYNEINHNFHNALAKTTGNPFIIETFMAVINKLDRAMARATKITDIRTALERHVERCEGIMKRDKSLAKCQLVTHLTETQSRVENKAKGD